MGWKTDAMRRVLRDRFQSRRDAENKIEWLTLKG